MKTYVLRKSDTPSMSSAACEYAFAATRGSSEKLIREHPVVVGGYGG